MLRSLKQFESYRIEATDGKIGKCSDFLFDEDEWRVRYLVVDTGGWLTGRKVVLSPHAISRVGEEEDVLPVSLSKDKIENSPSIDEHAPVSRLREAELSQYYAWPNYWIGMGYAAGGIYPTQGATPIATEKEVPDSRRALETSDQVPAGSAEDDQQRLHSINEVIGYNIKATDDTIGHVDDVLVRDDWSIAYLVVDTRNWLPGKQVLVSPAWADSVSWTDRVVRVRAARATIKEAPEYTGPKTVDVDFERRLRAHYNLDARS